MFNKLKDFLNLPDNEKKIENFLENYDLSFMGALFPLLKSLEDKNLNKALLLQKLTRKLKNLEERS